MTVVTAEMRIVRASNLRECSDERKKWLVDSDCTKYGYNGTLPFGPIMYSLDVTRVPRVSL
jgi:hypothetical protein